MQCYFLVSISEKYIFDFKMSFLKIIHGWLSIFTRVVLVVFKNTFVRISRILYPTMIRITKVVIQ